MPCGDQFLLQITCVCLWIVRIHAFCQSATDTTIGTYGELFYVPFPQNAIADAETNGFKYRVHLYNPNGFAINVAAKFRGDDIQTTTINFSVQPYSVNAFDVDFEYMMMGESICSNMTILSSGEPFGVRMTSSREMDGFVSHPTHTWALDYTAVTYCGYLLDTCQIIVISKDDNNEVTIELPEENSRTTLYSLNAREKGESITKVLMAEQAWQIQRDYDLTGAKIHATSPVGVLSGNAKAYVGEGYEQGAFMEQMPPDHAAGTEFTIFITPDRSVTGDLIRVVGLHDETTIFISSFHQRFLLHQGVYFTRRFTSEVVHIQANRPILVVKFSQSEDIYQEPGPPSMSLVVPTEQFSYGWPVVVHWQHADNEIIMVVTHTKYRDCFNDSIHHPDLTLEHEAFDESSDVVVQSFSLSAASTPSWVKFDCIAHPEAKIAVYHLYLSQHIMEQSAVAFLINEINSPCMTTDHSPGDGVDNDCDGDIDEDHCTYSSIAAHTDCSPIHTGFKMSGKKCWFKANGLSYTLKIASGWISNHFSSRVISQGIAHSWVPNSVDCELDTWGTVFTFVIPASSSESEEFQLLITKAVEIETDIMVVSAIDDGATLTINRLMEDTDKVTTIYILDEEFQLQGSQTYNNCTLQLRATQEISAVLVIMSGTGVSVSIGVSTRLIPDDTLRGLEYFVITHCDENECQFQVTSFHKGVTNVKLRLVADSSTSSADIKFNDVMYSGNEVICVSLKQYEALQLQATARDLTGTHIMSDKPVAVMSGGRKTMFVQTVMMDGLLEQLPPVVYWGKNYFVVMSPKNAETSGCSGSLDCVDRLKIVASTGLTKVEIYYGTNSKDVYTIANAGGHILVKMLSAEVKVKASKPILVMQIHPTAYYVDLEASIVTPLARFVTEDFVFLPQRGTFDHYFMVYTNRYTPSETLYLGLSYPGHYVDMTQSTALNFSYYSGQYTYQTTKPVLVEAVSDTFSIGGIVYSMGDTMAFSNPLSFLMNAISPTCELTPVTPDDGIDNDCDGAIDEEECSGWKLEDYDNDGMYNEDCREPNIAASQAAKSNNVIAGTNSIVNNTNSTNANKNNPNTNTNTNTNVKTDTNTNTNTNKNTDTNTNTNNNTDTNTNYVMSTETQDPTTTTTTLAYYTFTDTAAAVGGGNGLSATATYYNTVTDTAAAAAAVGGGNGLSATATYYNTATDTAAAAAIGFAAIPGGQPTATYYHNNTYTVGDTVSSTVSSEITPSTVMEESTPSTVMDASTPSTEIDESSLTLLDGSGDSNSIEISSALSLSDFSSPELSSLISSSSETNIPIPTMIEATSDIITSSNSFVEMSSSSSSLSSSSSSSSSSIIEISDTTTVIAPSAANIISSSETTTLSQRLTTTVLEPSSSLQPSPNKETTTIESNSYTPTPSCTSHCATSSVVDECPTDATDCSSSGGATSTPRGPVPGPDGYCSCQCPPAVHTNSLASSELKQVIQSIQDQLFVDKKEVSKAKRKLISVEDSRPSAQTVGWLGVALVAVMLVCLMAFDMPTLAMEFKALVRHCQAKQ